MYPIPRLSIQGYLSMGKTRGSLKYQYDDHEDLESFKQPWKKLHYLDHQHKFDRVPT